MKKISMLSVLAMLSFSLFSEAKPKEGGYFNNIPNSAEAIRREYGMDIGDVERMLLVDKNRAYSLFELDSGSTTKLSITPNPLSSYETFVPHKSQMSLSTIEKILLPIYLSNPKSTPVINFLALYHLDRSLLFSRGYNGVAFKHTVLAQYFMSRVKELGHKNRVLDELIQKVSVKLRYVDRKYKGITMEENHEAQKYFNDTFNYHEENRYIAEEMLLNDYVNNPNNIYTAFLNTAVNLWNGSEVDFADPSILYHFVVGSYFSVRTMELARLQEEAWERDPANNKLFRLAPILGGFSVLQRKGLAIIHRDEIAKQLIDDEHRAWHLIQPVFHGWTVGTSFWNEPFNFMEGYLAWEQAFSDCAVREVVTCLNRPRYSFNSAAMFVGRADFSLRLGNVDDARLFLFISHLMPNADVWDQGKEAVAHRENNLDAIAALYKNDDPADDPLHFNLKKNKWVGTTGTCQVCHQVQSAVWSQEDKDTILVSPEDVLSVGTWPELKTTWYGTLKNLK